MAFLLVDVGGFLGSEWLLIEEIDCSREGNMYLVILMKKQTKIYSKLFMLTFLSILFSIESRGTFSENEDMV